MLFPLVGAQLAAQQWAAELVLVDDGSLEPRPAHFLTPPPLGISSVEIVTLQRNGGHQLAIAVGLAHLAETSDADVVVVMDADGEDRPEDMIKLLDEIFAQPAPKVVFAARARRSEGTVFKGLYQIYCFAHHLLTGRQIRFGNFSVIPRTLLPRLLADPNLRVHYAASVVSGKIPYSSISSERGKRLHGRSKLNLVGLIAHGLAAITCYNEVVGVRLLFCTVALAAIFILLIVIAVAVRLGTDLAIPGWATYVTISLVVLLFQSIMLANMFIFMAISRRTHPSPPFLSYYRSLIHGTERIS